jgi:ABC-type glycerol-3-phosphate transport system substrate-binding protein
MACLLLLVLPGKRRRLPMMLAMLALMAAVGGMAGCGGSGGGSNSGNSGTTAGSYTVTVTATSGAIVQTTAITVTVQ